MGRHRSRAVSAQFLPGTANNLGYEPQPIVDRATTVRSIRSRKSTSSYDVLDKARCACRTTKGAIEDIIEPAVNTMAQDIEDRCAKYAYQHTPAHRRRPRHQPDDLRSGVRRRLQRLINLGAGSGKRAIIDTSIARPLWPSSSRCSAGRREFNARSRKARSAGPRPSTPSSPSRSTRTPRACGGPRRPCSVGADGQRGPRDRHHLAGARLHHRRHVQVGRQVQHRRLQRSQQHDPTQDRRGCAISRSCAGATVTGAASVRRSPSRRRCTARARRTRTSTRCRSRARCSRRGRARVAVGQERHAESDARQKRVRARRRQAEAAAERWIDHRVAAPRSGDGPGGGLHAAVHERRNENPVPLRLSVRLRGVLERHRGGPPGGSVNHGHSLLFLRRSTMHASRRSPTRPTASRRKS
jgi:hypothetical protein